MLWSVSLIIIGIFALYGKCFTYSYGDVECKEIHLSTSDHSKYTNSLESEVCFYVAPASRGNWLYAYSSILVKIRSLNNNEYTYGVVDCNATAPSFSWSLLERVITLLTLGRSTVTSSTHTLNPYKRGDEVQCLHIRFKLSGVNIEINHTMSYVDFSLAAVLLIGFFLMMHASLISRQPLARYVLGVIVGFFFSFGILLLLLYYTVNKSVTMRLLTSFMLLLSSGMGATLLTKYLFFTLYAYPQAVGIYAIATTFLSIAAIYYYGPIENRKLQNIFQWLLQLVGALMVYFSSNTWQVSVTIIVVTMTYIVTLEIIKNTALASARHNVCHSLTRIARASGLGAKKIPPAISGLMTPLKPLSVFRRLGQSFSRAPPEKSFISMREFEEQGIVHTKAALEELRTTILKDPKNIQLAKVLSRPMRYIDFVSGGDHVTEEERTEHESWLIQSVMCDDSEPYCSNRMSNNSEISFEELSEVEKPVTSSPRTPKTTRVTRSTSGRNLTR